MTVDITIFVKGDQMPADLTTPDAHRVTVINTSSGDVMMVDLRVVSNIAAHKIWVGRDLYVRLLDRFYLPSHHDVATTSAFFTRIAEQYDGLVDAERNVQNLVNLIRVASPESPSGSQSYPILDFGCGTGLSVLALSRLGEARASRLKLVGFDPCVKMRELASQRGLDVLPLSNCLDLIRAGPFGGAVASYVFHYGVEISCLKAIREALIVNGILALNFHKATSDDLEELDSRATTTGFHLTTRYDDPKHGSISIYRA